MPRLNTRTTIHRLHHTYIDQLDRHGDKSVVFALIDQVGALAQVLSLFSAHHINLKHIESRSSKRMLDNYEFLVTFDGINDASELIEDLSDKAFYVEFMSRERENNVETTQTMPWFPRRKRDLDICADNILMCGSELPTDHPGFMDKDYRLRRQYFANIAKSYRHGQQIPRVQYNQLELDTWMTVYDKVVPLHSRYACREYNHIWPLLEQNCDYRRDNIPQLEDVNQFLKDSTGFTLRPVAGLMSSRDFLAGLAYRVFHVTQYIRYHKFPHYSPEPDICHELIGHAPMFADPDFARFSQEIGLASLGAPEDDIMRLATCYWFTIEFGLCKQGSQFKAYGAGLLSSFSELEHAMSGVPVIMPFNPVEVGAQRYPVTEFQPVYFSVNSFADAQAKLRDFSNDIPKPSVFRYNPYTESVEALDSGVHLNSVTKDLQRELSTLSECMNMLHPLRK